jgi:hypothetical protein
MKKIVYISDFFVDEIAGGATFCAPMAMMLSNLRMQN